MDVTAVTRGPSHFACRCRPTVRPSLDHSYGERSPGLLSTALSHLRRQWIGVLALFLVLSGGGAYALSGHNSVSSDDIKNGQVKAADLAKPQKLKKAGLVKNDSFNCANAPNAWASSRPSTNGIVGYWRDLAGVVHL